MVVCGAFAVVAEEIGLTPNAQPGSIIAEYDGCLSQGTLRTTCPPVIALSISLLLVGFACGGSSREPLRAMPAPGLMHPRSAFGAVVDLSNVHGSDLVNDGLAASCHAATAHAWRRARCFAVHPATKRWSGGFGRYDRDVGEAS